jgi:hypothetical protein
MISKLTNHNLPVFLPQHPPPIDSSFSVHATTIGNRNTPSFPFPSKPRENKMSLECTTTNRVANTRLEIRTEDKASAVDQGPTLQLQTCEGLDKGWK